MLSTREHHQEDPLPGKRHLQNLIAFEMYHINLVSYGFTRYSFHSFCHSFLWGKMAQVVRARIYWPVRCSNPTSAFRLSLSRLGLGQPCSIPAVVQPLGGMAVRHRKDATAAYLIAVRESQVTVTDAKYFLEVHRETWCRWLIGWSANLLTGRSVVRTRPPYLDLPCLGLGNVTAFVLPSGSMAARHRKRTTAERLQNHSLQQLSSFSHLNLSSIPANGCPY
ncbi:hypothetical protein CSKR_111446 [Clonorchis sinensis]|uniref:Uncharacterized protein n=1 Tax=Clonorchis sinensis TaxID=79923 RepID=A0A419PRV0_CLOSI|nr:hypothetical protein CSKR_111446 [Clonorchis sinensis]